MHIVINAERGIGFDLSSSARQFLGKVPGNSMRMRTNRKLIALLMDPDRKFRVGERGSSLAVVEIPDMYARLWELHESHGLEWVEVQPANLIAQQIREIDHLHPEPSATRTRLINQAWPLWRDLASQDVLVPEIIYREDYTLPADKSSSKR